MRENDNTKVQINVQMPLSVREDFRIAARMEGQSMSALLYRHILQTIRKAKETSPQLFSDFKESVPHVVNESEFDRLLYEAFDGRPIDDETRHTLGEALKSILAVREIALKD